MRCERDVDGASPTACLAACVDNGGHEHKYPTCAQSRRLHPAAGGFRVAARASVERWLCAPLALRLERAAEFLMGATFAREGRVLFHCDALHDIGKIVINALTLTGGVDARQSAGTW